MRLLSSALTVLVVLAGGAADAFAGEVTTYAGTLGNANIIVELAAPGKEGAFLGRYAYMVKGVDIPLSSVSAKGVLTLEEEKPCTDKICRDDKGDIVHKAPVGAEWSLERDTSGKGLEGTWTDKDSGKTLPVKLAKRGARMLEEDVVSADMLDPGYIDSVDDNSTMLTAKDLPYDFLKLDHPYKQGKVVAIGDSAYRMDLDSRVGLDFPTVVKLGNANPAMLNRGLMGQRLRWGIESYSCYSRVYLSYSWTGSETDGTNGFDGSAQVLVDYLTPRLMGITESGSFDCDSARPDNFQTHILLDARTGKPVKARDLLNNWVPRDYTGALIEPADVGDPNAVTWGPDDKLAKYVLDHRNEDGASTDPECGIANLVKTNLGVYFRDDKLVFALVDLPTVTVACGGDLLSMTIKDARPFLTRRGARYFAELDK